MEIFEGAVLLPGEIEKVKAALGKLADDSHAPREVSVKIRLHVHHEYPKHIQVGEKLVVVNSAEEEKALSPAE